MPALSRRGAMTAAMGVTASVVMPPVPPVSGALLPAAPDPDARLLHLCAAHMGVDQAIDALQEPWMDHPGGTPKDVCAEIDRLAEVSWSYRRRIAQHQAHTLSGLQAKARIVKRYSNADSRGEMDPDSDEAIAFSLARDLLRLPDA
ncbi:hypothetical protein [Falsiroseomonas tokyonensis]|uniref:Uncharacterized protein n=1 Tax=Falsiroseomonas tokyonensis TaxID=430521 RepID=A0ABV7C2E2_9PROT|nr:hypothetical protein [Falsiroseomonas tokyonensis]MBU8540811.1 hypothetical protein [Falsiroseomonas tokyonensis]